MTNKIKFPKNYLELSNEEMSTLEGGDKTTRQIWIPTQTRRISRSNFAISNDLGNLVIGAALSVVTWGLSILVVTASAIGSAFLGRSGSVALAEKAEKAEKADGKYNGWVTRTITGHYRTETNPYPPHSYDGAMF